jgi:hypothetical protein
MAGKSGVMIYTIELDGKKVDAEILALYAHYPSPATCKLRLKNGEIIIRSITDLINDAN